MIWELRIPTVVMLTRIFEGRVSDRGWAGCGVFTRLLTHLMLMG